MINKVPRESLQRWRAQRRKNHDADTDALIRHSYAEGMPIRRHNRRSPSFPQIDSGTMEGMRQAQQMGKDASMGRFADIEGRGLSVEERSPYLTATRDTKMIENLQIELKKERELRYQMQMQLLSVNHKVEQLLSRERKQEENWAAGLDKLSSIADRLRIVEIQLPPKIVELDNQVKALQRPKTGLSDVKFNQQVFERNLAQVTNRLNSVIADVRVVNNKLETRQEPVFVPAGALPEHKMIATGNEFQEESGQSLQAKLVTQKLDRLEKTVASFKTQQQKTTKQASFQEQFLSGMAEHHQKLSEQRVGELQGTLVAAVQGQALRWEQNQKEMKLELERLKSSLRDHTRTVEDQTASLGNISKATGLKASELNVLKLQVTELEETLRESMKSMHLSVQKLRIDGQRVQGVQNAFVSLESEFRKTVKKFDSDRSLMRKETSDAFRAMETHGKYEREKAIKWRQDLIRNTRIRFKGMDKKIDAEVKNVKAAVMAVRKLAHVIEETREKLFAMSRDQERKEVEGVWEKILSQTELEQMDKTLLRAIDESASILKKDMVQKLNATKIVLDNHINDVENKINRTAQERDIAAWMSDVTSRVQRNSDASNRRKLEGEIKAGLAEIDTKMETTEIRNYVDSLIERVGIQCGETALRMEVAQQVGKNSNSVEALRVKTSNEANRIEIERWGYDLITQVELRSQRSSLSNGIRSLGVEVNGVNQRQQTNLIDVRKILQREEIREVESDFRLMLKDIAECAVTTSEKNRANTFERVESSNNDLEIRQYVDSMVSQVSLSWEIEQVKTALGLAKWSQKGTADHLKSRLKQLEDKTSQKLEAQAKQVETAQCTTSSEFVALETKLYTHGLIARVANEIERKEIRDALEKATQLFDGGAKKRQKDEREQNGMLLGCIGECVNDVKGLSKTLREQELESYMSGLVDSVDRMDRDQKALLLAHGLSEMKETLDEVTQNIRTLKARGNDQKDQKDGSHTEKKNDDDDDNLSTINNLYQITNDLMNESTKTATILSQTKKKVEDNAKGIESLKKTVQSLS